MSRRSRGVCALAAAAALSFSLVGSAVPVSATPAATVERLAGASRYDTARAIALDTFDSATTAFIASGLDFPDAMAANGIAGARIGPILLVNNGVPAATANTLTELGVENVVILGGPAAVNGQIESTLAGDYAVTRLSGATRIETAVEIAKAIDSGIGIGAVDGKRAAFVARSDGFADALMVGPLAYHNVTPVLLTETARLSAATSAALDDLDIEIVVIAGGESAVSAAVKTTIEGKGIEVVRLGGATRAETATIMADFAIDQLGFSETHVNVADSADFPDAMTGGPHGGGDEMSVILLTGSGAIGTVTTDWIAGRCATINSVHVFGGPAAVSASTVGQLEQAARSC